MKSHAIHMLKYTISRQRLVVNLINDFATNNNLLLDAQVYQMSKGSFLKNFEFLHSNGE